MPSIYRTSKSRYRRAQIDAPVEIPTANRIYRAQDKIGNLVGTQARTHCLSSRGERRRLLELACAQQISSMSQCRCHRPPPSKHKIGGRSVEKKRGRAVTLMRQTNRDFGVSPRAFRSSMARVVRFGSKAGIGEINGRTAKLGSHPCSKRWVEQVEIHLRHSSPVHGIAGKVQVAGTSVQDERGANAVPCGEKVAKMARTRLAHGRAKRSSEPAGPHMRNA